MPISVHYQGQWFHSNFDKWDQGSCYMFFCVMSKNIALAMLTEEIKRHSSRWIKTRGPHYKQFAWQGGYAGFSVSQSLIEKRRDILKCKRNITKR